MEQRVSRYDSGELKKARLSSQGYLKADALATRAGIFLYKKADGSIQRELRPPEEVFHPDSLESLSEVPVTNNHPQQSLNAENTKLLAVGYTGSDVSKAGDFVKCGVTVFDKNSINEVMSGGKRQLSGGYTCNLDMNPGIWNGQQYDAIQKDIRYNHLAIVQNGRAGEMAAIKLDSQDAVMVEEEKENASVQFEQTKNSEEEKIKSSENLEADAKKNDVEEKKDSAKLSFDVNPEKENTKGDKIMAKLKIDSIEYELPDAVANHIAKLDSSVSDTKKSVESLQGKLDVMIELQKKNDAGKGPSDDEMDKKDKAKKMDAAEAIAYGREFVEVETLAKSVLGKEFKSDASDLLAIKKAVLSKALPEVKLDGKSDEYVSAMFDHFKLNYKSPKADQLQKGIGKIKNDSTIDINQVRFDSMQKFEENWKKPLRA